MKPDIFTLKDGREVRVEWNMNSMKEFTDLTGKELTDLAGVKADLGLLRTVAWCSIREGEAADGKSFDVTETELGRLMGVAEIIKFSEIMTRQGDPGGEKKSAAPNRFAQIFNRAKV